MTHASQIIMLYALNLHSAACQFSLNKIGRKEHVYINMYTISRFCVYRHGKELSQVKHTDLVENSHLEVG